MIHHVCVEKHITICDGEPIPFGALALLEDVSAVLPALLSAILPKIGKGDVSICGEGDARRILGRKIEDTIKRPVLYE